MKSVIYDRLLQRELGKPGSYAGIRGIYGDKVWVDDMDIVNELGGHTGCVNALNWSTSGKLLASGSDDQHVNIYSYQPESTTSPFFLNTTILTGHSANIFSVKFMPHSNDRTLISCAGDSEVRVFDIEYSGRSANTAVASARSRRFNNFFNGMWYLTEGNTNCRVYRSHADRVKRIVTESSPYLFLTCSEDGEVRQWDLRQPSSAYPSPRGGQGFMAYRPGLHHDDSNVPPPLISYKKYHIDLNTISCAASQPHYIALGGAHLHCFLHDRRMMGRDLLEERGQTGSLSGISSHDDEVMGQATRCVRRFAPNGQKKMRSRDNGHITACKISYANPTESDTSSTRHQSRLRSEDGHGGEDMSFRVRYGNGESEDIPLDSLSGSRATDVPEDVLERARESVLNEAQKLSLRIAKGLVEIRKLLFSVDRPMREFAEASPASGPTPYTASFTSVLGYAATYLPEMDEVIRTWRYPLNPSHDDVLFQQALRRNRESSRRFVQASGTLARVLGGRLQTATGGESPQLALFRKIGPAPTEDGMIDPSSQFGYDFLKAILLWLEGGRQAILEGFKRRGVSRRDADRFPLLESAEDEAIEETLIPYFRELAGTEQSLTLTLRAGDGDGSETRTILSLDKNAAIRFWGLKVGRGILMEVGEGVNFEFVNRAFGGLRTVIEEDEDEDDGRERLQEDIDPDEEEEPISEVRLITGRSSSSRRRHHDTSEQNAEPQETSATNATEHSEDQRASAETDEEEDDEDDSEELDEDDEEEEDDDDDEDDERDTSESDEEEGRLFIRNSSSGRRRGVESHIPCSSHLSVYRGHCNIKTVKDVNYFGLNDEYVVSGSDCGNIFIWDRKTSDLVNILSGDSDVVNVVQGHPYEPTLAVSGIDNTIKIFSPDARAQHDASVGINIADPDAQANIVAGNPAGGNRTERSALGLRSRKRMQDSYQITSQNDVNRQGGMNEAFITRSMLARLAASLRERQAIRVGFNTTEGEEGGRIVLDENCNELVASSTLYVLDSG
ncbi:WD repeat containing protein [Coccidioides immitis H538.4]|uniref:WD repeat containing protein n=1 Tax=Coccidioides immitis H538.4 TaxID=396776 RepID=A0A0J8RNQ8_COCIT|nr:WD repeat containing protein [Coccidioides immitis H538.4]